MANADLSTIILNQIIAFLLVAVYSVIANDVDRWR